MTIQSAKSGEDNDDTGTYTVNIYGQNATMISEYSMEVGTDGVFSIEEAELRARENLETCNFSEVIVVVTEETLQGFNQVQIKVRPAHLEAVRES